MNNIADKMDKKSPKDSKKIAFAVTLVALCFAVAVIGSLRLGF